jgi:F0F1-type ATP synthase membrane subunit b/b'
MADRTTAEEKLAALREVITSARSMPMSASCVVNRNDVLAAIDDVIENLPDEIAEAQDVIDASKSTITEGEEQAARILADAREQAAGLAQHTEVIKVAERDAAKIRADAEEEAAALRREVDIFIDTRMASFESVLHKTTSQVTTARQRLAQRSHLDRSDEGHGEGRGEGRGEGQPEGRVNGTDGRADAGHQSRPSQPVR